MIPSVYIQKKQEQRELSDREKDILRTLIHLYLLNAAPVGSRILSKFLEYELKLSPATIRNIMSDLEEMNYISHPHTSAGRIPTDKGYRFYVDTLMQTESLTEKEINVVKDSLAAVQDVSVLRDASKLLGMLSKYLGIVELPHLSDFNVQKFELISLSSTKLLIVIALDSDIVRTVTLEAVFEVDYRQLDEIAKYINERITGKPLKFIKENFKNIISDFSPEESPLIRLFVESVDKLFTQQKQSDRIHIAGTQNLLNYPEFEDLSRIRGVIELIENEDIIIHLLDKYEPYEGDTKILIGKELQHELLEDYSLIVTNYQFGSALGSIGLIGPKRMNYSRMISIVQNVSAILSKNI